MFARIVGSDSSGSKKIERDLQMHVSSCRTYHSKTVGNASVQLPDGKSVFKIYYVSIIGRDEPARFEWGKCALTPEAFEAMVTKSGWEGIGFVTAFPHITKVFRFAPSMETVLHVRAFNTADLKPLSLEREDGFVEFACYAEAAIASDEYHAWARAGSVEEYLKFRSVFVDGPVRTNRKLAEYVGMKSR
jgi:hypothetical protein